MKLIDFQINTLSQQLDILYEEGIFIGKRKMRNKTVLLYQVEGFYVEVFYKKHRCYASEIRSSISTRLLDPYLDQVQVEQLWHIGS